MDMDHLIGQRFNLISKSEIRYVGTLHEINPEQSTIALENVFSFGTEDRKVANFIPPSQQKFDYIVFRGSDVKDIKIAEEQPEPKQPSPPSVPNDPAILNASRPGPPQGPGDHPFPPPGYPPQHQFGGYYPPPQFGRGFGPPPGNFGPGPGFPGYGPPPPGYFGPPGQGFPPPGSQAPIGPPGQRNFPPPNQQPQQPQAQQQNQAPVPNQPTQSQTSELPVENKTGNKNATTTQTKPTEITDTQPPVPEALPQPSTKAPTGPKSNRVAPAVPLTVNQKSFTPPVSTNDATATNGAAKTATKPTQSQAAMDEAARQAKEAVAAAMAKLNPSATTQTKQAKPTPTAPAIDDLTKRVKEMGPSNNATQRGRGGQRGAGRGNYQRNVSGGHPNKKMEIPKSDYDFETANAKFNKEDLIKEAIASGAPAEEATNGDDTEDVVEGITRKDSIPTGTTQAYNRTTSFFDNISSEAKDRGDNDTRPNGRQVRGEEFKKNMETFGQGNVDGGYRGRGRGGFGRGRHYGGNQRGYNRGYGGGGYRGRGRGGQGQTPVQSGI